MVTSINPVYSAGTLYCVAFCRVYSPPCLAETLVIVQAVLLIQQEPHLVVLQAASSVDRQVRLVGELCSLCGRLGEGLRKRGLLSGVSLDDVTVLNWRHCEISFLFFTGRDGDSEYIRINNKVSANVTQISNNGQLVIQNPSFSPLFWCLLFIRDSGSYSADVQSAGWLTGRPWIEEQTVRVD